MALITAMNNELTDSDTESTDETDDGFALPFWGISWPKAIVLALAVAFLAGAAGHWIGRSGPPGSDSVDAGFFQDMIHHHNQAISMALYEQANGSDPVVVGYANEILRRQSYEIGVMSTKLGEWGYTTAPGEQAMAWMGMPVPLDQMPGLATDEQMKQLRDARGAESDKLFLELMTAHHRGGVHMAEHAYRHATNDSTRDLAQRMAYIQATEVNEFRDTAQRNNIPVTIDPQPVTVPNPSAAES
jgi:uncharacterized protein (DUF305 family)